MAELLTTGQPIRDRELILERPDGTRVTVLANLDPLFDDEGRLVGGVNCFQDISERKAAEERFKAREAWYRGLLDALPAAIYTTDAQGPHHLLQSGRGRAFRPAPGTRQR